MKIGHYMQGIWQPGGIATYIRRISEAQAQEGHAVVFYDLASCRAMNGGGPHPPVSYVDSEARLFAQAGADGLDMLHVHTGLSQRVPSGLPVIRTVHGHQPYCPSGGRCLDRAGVPCNQNYSLVGCLWQHGANHCGSVRPQRIVQEFRRTWDEMRTLRAIPAVAVSRFIKEQMVRNGYQDELIHVLHLPAPAVKPPSPPREDGVPRFVFLGRITSGKGVEWLLRSLPLVQVPIHVDIAGEGPQDAAMRRLALALGLQDRVTFHGWVSPAQVNTLLADARALVFPSIWHEPGGTVAFEAMVNSRAVVMSAVGGMPEVVHHEQNGLLVEPSNREMMAAALTRLAQDYPLARALGERGREMAITTFTMRNHVMRLLELYGHYQDAAPAPGR